MSPLDHVGHVTYSFINMLFISTAIFDNKLCPQIKLNDPFLIHIVPSTDIFFKKEIVLNKNYLILNFLLNQHQLWDQHH